MLLQRMEQQILVPNIEGHYYKAKDGGKHIKTLHLTGEEPVMYRTVTSEDNVVKHAAETEQ